MEFWQPQFLTNLVVANTQLLNLFVCYVHFFTGFKIHTVDDAVRVDVFAVGVGADKDFTALEISGKLPRCFVGCARVNVRALRKTLHHVIKHHATFLMVQQLRTQELIERRFRLASDSADELHPIPARLIFLCHIPHHTFHAAARLCAFLVIHEMDDCDFALPPSCRVLNAVLIFANSCAAVSRLANCILPIFASAVS